MGTGPPSPYDDGTTRSGFEDARTRERIMNDLTKRKTHQVARCG